MRTPYAVLGAIALSTVFLVGCSESGGDDPGAKFTVKSIAGDHTSVFAIGSDNARELKIGSKLKAGEQVVVTDPATRLSLIDGRGRLSHVCTLDSPLNLTIKPTIPWYIRFFKLSKHETEQTVVNASTRSASKEWPVFHLVKYQNLAIAGQPLSFNWLPDNKIHSLQIKRQREDGKVFVHEKNLSGTELTVDGDQVPPGLYTVRIQHGENQDTTLETTLAIVEQPPSSPELPSFLQTIPKLKQWMQCKKMTTSPDWQWFASFNCTDKQTKWMLDELEHTEPQNQTACSQ